MALNATIAGTPILGNATVMWQTREGTEPVMQVFFVAKDAAKMLANATPSPVSLEIIDDQKQKHIWKNLWVLSEEAGPNPHIGAIRVADRRWFWSRKHVYRRYNVQRKLGVKRIGATDVAELQSVAPDIGFEAPTLNREKLWTPLDAIKDVIDEAMRLEVDYAGTTYRIRGTNIHGIRQSSIQNLEINETGDLAIRRIVGYIPDLALYINRAGDIVLKNKNDGSDIGTWNTAKQTETVAGSHIEVISRRNEMPKAIDVLFQREVEVRFDFVEDTQSETVVQPDDRRRFNNVIIVPDHTVSINGETVIEGTPVVFDDYLDAIGSAPGIGKKITQSLIRRAMIPFVDLWGPLQLLGDVEPDVNWMARISAIQAHWRTTYQVPRRWMDRIISLRPYRVGTIDPVTGNRAKATVYTNYCRVGTQKFFYKQPIKDPGLGQNVEGYADTLSSSAVPAPAEVLVLDGDLGVIRMEFRTDPHLLYEMTLPGLIDVDTVPTTIPGQRGKTVAWNTVIHNAAPPQLKSGHKAAFLLTAIPSVNTLHRMTIKAADVKPLLPAHMHKDLDNARGPKREIFVGPGVETARVRWLDSRSSDIEKLFGVGTNQKDPPPNVDDLTINLGEQKNIRENAASLSAIANAVAARGFALYTTRPRGNASVGQIGLEPLGWLDTVTTIFNTDGTLFSMLNWPEDTPQIDFLSLLDASTRAIILKEALKR